MSSVLIILVLSIVASGHDQILTTEAFGVNYGMIGNNLPTPPDVIAMYKQYNISKLRLFDPNTDALNALRGTTIEVTVGTRNGDIPLLASGLEAAQNWVGTYLAPFSDVNIAYVTVGNEEIPGQFSQDIAVAISNLQSVVQSSGMNRVQVTTVVAMAALGSSYPPSNGMFGADSRDAMVATLQSLKSSGAPIMLNAYPYFAYAGDQQQVGLDYAQFTAPGQVVSDGNLGYQNLLEAMVDAFYAAMEREGFPDIRIIVSESGWPSAGNGDITTPQLAATYNRNYVNKIKVGTGTPRRPSVPFDGFIFAMFDENQKAEGIEQHWGLFNGDKTPVYPLL